jgi:hypothetical protein
VVTNVFIKVGDFFLDKQNNGDEKRFFGCAFLVASLIYVFTQKDIAGFLAISGVGTTLLGVASVTDKIK